MALGAMSNWQRVLIDLIGMSFQRGHKGMDQDQGFDVGENVEKGTQKRPLEGVR